MLAAFAVTTKTLEDCPVSQLGIQVMSTKKEKKGKVDIDVQGFPLVTGFVTGWEGFQLRRGGLCYKRRFSFVKVEVCQIFNGSLVYFLHYLFGDRWGN